MQGANAVRRLASVSLGVVALAALMGCGSDDSSDDTTSSESAATSTGSATMDELYKGSITAPPTQSPPPAKGKKVWWIACSMAVPACAVPAQNAVEAGKALGMKVSIGDGKFNAGGAFSGSIRTALAADPDAILLHGIPCPPVRQALEEAKSQGVKVMGVESNDCSDTGGPDLFGVQMKYTEQAQDDVALWKSYGEASARYIIAKTGGEAKIIDGGLGKEPQQAFVSQGFRNTLEKDCPGCEIVASVPYSSPDLVPNGPWIQAFRSALVRNPDATAVYIPFDVMMGPLGGVKAVTESGREMITFGGQGLADTLDLVRDGQLSAISSAHPAAWLGWAGMDTINRAFNNEPTVPQGIGFAVVDETHGLPSKPGTIYEPPVDFKAAYLKAWQAGGEG